MKILWLALILFVGTGTSSIQAQGHAHQHGALTLDVSVEASSLTLQMSSPLDNLLGFERAPRTAAERQRTDAAIARLKAADTLFKIDPAAQCTLSQVTLISDTLKLGAAPATPPPAQGSHADIDVEFQYQCTGTPASFVEVGLFDAFSGMKTIAVQVATAKGQFKRSLKRPAKRLSLLR